MNKRSYRIQQDDIRFGWTQCLRGTVCPSLAADGRSRESVDPVRFSYLGSDQRILIRDFCGTAIKEGQQKFIGKLRKSMHILLTEIIERFFGTCSTASARYTAERPMTGLAAAFKLCSVELPLL